MAKTFLPPKFEKTTIEFRNKYITVKSDSLILRRDSNGEVEELRKDYYTADCEDFVIGIVIKDNKLLLTNQYRVPLRNFNTEFVAGTIEKNETPEEAITKELIEEAGIKANSLRFLGKFHPLTGFNSCQGYVYLIDDFEEVESKLEIYEEFTNLTTSWITIDEFKILLQSNKIVDGVTLMAWALFREIIDVMP